MDIETFRNYCLQKKGTEECFPFDEVTLVFKVMGKMYALAGLDNIPPSVNLKANPDKCIEWREEYPGLVIPGYHMNKTHWNTIYMEDGLDDRFIQYCIDHSYQMIVDSLPKKQKEILASL